MEKYYVCSEGHRHTRGETRQTGGRRICAEHGAKITHAVFICDCDAIEDNLTIAQVARRTQCAECAQEAKKADSRRRYQASKPVLAEAPPHPEPVKIIKWDDCAKYPRCIATAALSGDDLNCYQCAGYHKAPDPDPADYLGTGNSANSMMGKLISFRTNGPSRGWI